MSLPPLRELDAAAAPGGAERYAADLPGCDRVRARAMGALLAEARGERGLAGAGPRIFVSAGDPGAAPPPWPGMRWAPHLLRWTPPGTVGLAWEADTPERLATLLDAPAAAIATWAEQPAALLRIAMRAPRTGGGSDGYLSLRWLLAHPEAAVAAATSDLAFDHVSLHATPQEMSRVRALLRDGLGLVEVARPACIDVAGHWLAAGSVRVHLNARDHVAAPASGTAPNHVGFCVAQLDDVQAAVESHGFACQRAGSLGEQAWFRLESGTVIELQRLTRTPGSVPAPGRDVGNQHTRT